ncbi:MAG: MMPL family transporter [Chitinivibrionales bacterium]|nr:MMPL family transporter [Chitinivibrionales bacterium]
MNDREARAAGGPLAYMARNSVAANLIMAIMIVGGLLVFPTIKQEVFPEVTLDMVMITVPYPGASPEEVEQGIILSVEEAVRGIDGVKEVRATAYEGLAQVTAELYSAAPEDRALNDIQSAVDRITSFPTDAEEPTVRLLSPRRQVVSIIIYGAIAPGKLRAIAENFREELLNEENITQVEIDGIPAPQISVEVPMENLRRYNLTLQEIAAIIASASVDIPGGAIETPTGEILLRTTERRRTVEEFKNIAVLAGEDGSRITVGDIADVYEDYEIQDLEAFYDGQRAVRIIVYRVGAETPVEVSNAVHDFVEQARKEVPEQVGLAVWDDSSEIFQDRISLLLKNGLYGLVLVLFILGLFLKINHALWVTVGMGASFCGSFFFMGMLGVSINMISLFAFILVLGIVVDDAIVVGESIFNRRRQGESPLASSIDGVREVAIPVVFSVLTTIIAFGPLLFIPGVMGKLFSNIPLIVIPILLLSLFESLFVLPAHLAHHERKSPWGIIAWLNRRQEGVSKRLEHWIEHSYTPWLKRLVDNRAITLSLALAILIVAFGLVAGGIIKFIFFPKIEGDTATATIELPFGSSLEQTRSVMDQVVAAAQRVEQTIEKAENEQVVTGIFAEAGGMQDEGGPVGEIGEGAAHQGFVTIQLVSAGERSISSRQFSQMWRQETGAIPGVERLAFDFSIGPSGGAALAVELSHSNIDRLEQAAEQLAQTMGEYAGVFDIDDGFRRGKRQIDFRLRPGARALGISEADLARQLRSAWFGAEAVRQQRGREELRVYVRLPREQRISEYSLEQMIIQTRQGGEIPLNQAAYIAPGRSFTTIERKNGRRVVAVTADVNPAVTNAQQVYDNLSKSALPQLKQEFPGLSWERAGQQEEMTEAFGSLRTGMTIALLIMYGVMAMVFQSYIQPIIVMAAIPFGVVGAFLGHLIMGYQLSLVSMLGIVALAGVVVNDSLVLITVINDNRREGMGPFEAVLSGGQRRFRPVLLTSLTTFFGLVPMIFETSLQAKFLIPMALSLGFGVLFVTIIALVIVPSAYMALEDVRKAVVKIAKG